MAMKDAPKLNSFQTASLEESKECCFEPRKRQKSSAQSISGTTLSTNAATRTSTATPEDSGEIFAANKVAVASRSETGSVEFEATSGISLRR